MFSNGFKFVCSLSIRLKKITLQDRKSFFLFSHLLSYLFIQYMINTACWRNGWINEWMNEWTIRCENRHFKISPKSKNNKFLENKALYFKSDNIFSLKLPSSGLLYQVYSGPQCLWRPYLESGNCFKRKLF